MVKDVEIEETVEDGIVEYRLRGHWRWEIMAFRLILLVASISAGLARRWVVASLLFLIFTLLRSRKTENVLAIHGLGLQLDSKGYMRLLSGSSQFFGVQEIGGIFINEAFNGFGVVPVLQVAIPGANELHLVIKGLSPRLAQQQHIWLGLRAVLHLKPQGAWETM